jgi:hypothetical protein
MKGHLPKQSTNPPLPKGARNVMVATLDNGLVRGEFMKSMVDMVAWDANYDHKIHSVIRSQSSANISNSRNFIVEEFLSSSAQKLMMIDSDMVFKPDLVHRLAEDVDGETPIVGGLTWRVSKVDGKVSTTMYLLDDNDQLMQPAEWPEDALVQVWATGAAVLMVHRSAFEKVKKAEFSPAFPYFQESTWKGDPVSEDVTFCVRAQMVHCPVLVDTGVEVGHVKERILSIKDWRFQQQAENLTGMVESFTRDGVAVPSLDPSQPLDAEPIPESPDETALAER